METQETIINLISKHSYKDDIELSDMLSDDLGFDSLDCAELILDIDRELGIDVYEESFELGHENMTVGEVIELIESKMEEN